MKDFCKIPWLKANTTPKVIILFELSDKLGANLTTFYDNWSRFGQKKSPNPAK